MNPQDTEGFVPEAGKAVVKFTGEHAQEVGLPSPQAINYMMSIANMLSSSALVGKDMGLSKDQITQLTQWGIKGEDMEKRQNAAIRANAMAKMLVGREFVPPIPPMSALREIDIVKSKVFVEYPHLIAQIEAKGYEIVEVERSHSRAAIELKHPTKQTRTFEFTFEDAQRAGLTKRGGYNGDSPSQYELRPRVMLWSRVISEAYRATGGRASTYTPEEKREVLAEEAEPGAPKEPEENPYFVGETTPLAQSAQNRDPRGSSAQPGSAESGSSGPLRAQGEQAGPSEPPVSQTGQSGPAPQPKGERNDNAGSQDASSGEGTPGLEAEHEPSQSGAQAGREGNGAAGDPPTAGVPVSETPSRPENITTQQTATVNTAHSSGATDVGAGTTEGAVPPHPKVVPIRLADATDKIARLLPDKKHRDKLLNQFLSGFFNLTNVKSIPKSDPRLIPALALLSEIADKFMPQLMSDPHGTGLLCTAGWRGLEKFMDTHAWPEDCRDLARAIARERYADSGGGDLLEWLQDPVKVEELPVPELRTFLQVLARTREALRLREMASDQVSMCEIVQSWGLDLLRCSEAEIVAKLGSRADVHTEEEPGDLFDFVRSAPEP